MRRRDFIAVLGGAAIAWAWEARAQQLAMPVVGYLCVQSLESRADLLTAFRQGLNETGYFEGQNITIEYRPADDHAERLPTLAKQLVDRHVAVIVAAGGNATGVSILAGLLGVKRLELVRQLVPMATTIGILTNPTNPANEIYINDAQQAARALGVQSYVLNASNVNEIDTAFVTLSAQKLEVLLVITDSLFIGRREQIEAHAAALAMPAIYEYR